MDVEGGRADSGDTARRTPAERYA